MLLKWFYHYDLRSHVTTQYQGDSVGGVYGSINKIGGIFTMSCSYVGCHYKIVVFVDHFRMLIVTAWGVLDVEYKL